MLRYQRRLVFPAGSGLIIIGEGSNERKKKRGGDIVSRKCLSILSLYGVPDLSLVCSDVIWHHCYDNMYLHGNTILEIRLMFLWCNCGPETGAGECSAILGTEWPRLQYLLCGRKTVFLFSSQVTCSRSMYRVLFGVTRCVCMISPTSSSYSSSSKSQRFQVLWFLSKFS